MENKNIAKKNNKLFQKYGEWAVITGASDGIGKEFAKSLSKLGFNLVLIARRKEKLEELAKSITNEYQTQCLVIAIDLNILSSIDHILELTKDKKVGLLVASAGFGTSGQFLKSNLQSEIEMINVNCIALMNFSYHFGKKFAQQKRGGIILMSSLVAFQGVPNAANYAATKAYVQTFAEGLNHELKPFGVDVIASAPGPINSGFASRSNMKMGMSASPSTVADSTLKALGKGLTVRPGFLSKFLESSLMVLPRWGRVRIMSLIMGGMTKHQS